MARPDGRAIFLFQEPPIRLGSFETNEERAARIIGGGKSWLINVANGERNLRMLQTASRANHWRRGSQTNSQMRR
jgi:hypothetical protein